MTFYSYHDITLFHGILSGAHRRAHSCHHARDAGKVCLLNLIIAPFSRSSCKQSVRIWFVSWNCIMWNHICSSVCWQTSVTLPSTGSTGSLRLWRISQNALQQRNCPLHIASSRLWKDRVPFCIWHRYSPKETLWDRRRGSVGLMGRTALLWPVLNTRTTGFKWLPQLCFCTAA